MSGLGVVRKVLDKCKQYSIDLRFKSKLMVDLGKANLLEHDVKPSKLLQLKLLSNGLISVWE